MEVISFAVVNPICWATLEQEAICIDGRAGYMLQRSDSCRLPERSSVCCMSVLHLRPAKRWILMPVPSVKPNSERSANFAKSRFANAADTGSLRVCEKCRFKRLKGKQVYTFHKQLLKCASVRHSY